MRLFLDRELVKNPHGEKNLVKMEKRGFTITKRLYLIVGLMGSLVFLELLAVRFAMSKLSATRAFVGGESIWSKAQKDALNSLQQFGITKNEDDFNAFLDYLKITHGDHDARMELSKKNPDLELVRKGFRIGKIDERDLDPMINLLRQFYWIKYLKTAIQYWIEADELVGELEKLGLQFHFAIKASQYDKAAIIMVRIKEINSKLTVVEEGFSHALAEGSHFVENSVLFLLTIAVIMVETIGLALAVLTAKSISRGLRELSQVARRIGGGDYLAVISNRNDEIGDLAIEVLNMGRMLSRTYDELENRVQERTAALLKLAEDNSRLYDEASIALRRRDEFLSLASHELKTPITAMLLQAQIFQRPKSLAELNTEKMANYSKFMERQLLRMNLLVEEMLDTSRIDLSKLSLHLEEVNLSAMVREICERFGPQFQIAKIEFTYAVEDSILGIMDGYRVEQVINNLISNALKYAAGKPVTVSLARENGQAIFSIQDQGIGIDEKDRERIFHRFERGVSALQFGGLGIGLFIAKAIVVAHGGTIQVESRLGAGAMFKVVLPLLSK